MDGSKVPLGQRIGGQQAASTGQPPKAGANHQRSFPSRVARGIEHQLSVSTGEATAQEGQLDGVGPLSVCACLPTSRASEGIYICQHGQGTNLSIF